MVYTFIFLYDDMDVDDYMTDIIPLEVSLKDELRVYVIQIFCWSMYLW